MHLVGNKKVTDFENSAVNGKVKTARAIYMAMLNAIMAEADKFGLVPQFTPDEEAKPNFFYFLPVSYKQDATKGCLEVKAEGIKAWLKYNKVYDNYYNPEKPEDEYWDILDPKGDFFAPKLAALIRAWREVTITQNEYFYKNHGTAKKAIEACLKKHAESWHLADEDSQLSDDSIARLARIANWDDKTGPKK